MIHILQPCFPNYRRSLFLKLAEIYDLALYYGRDPGGMRNEYIKSASIHDDFDYLKVFDVMYWQRRVFSIKLNKGDVLVISGDVRLLSNYFLCLYAKFVGVKIVWWGQGWSARTTNFSFAIRISIFKYLANVYLAYSENELGKISSQGVAKNRIFATNNSIDISRVDSAIKNYTEDDLFEFAAKNNILGRKVYFSIGRITSKFNHVFAIDTLLELLKLDSTVLFVVIGSGDCLGDLIARAESHGVIDSLIHVEGTVDEMVIAPWILSSSLFFYPGAVGLSLMHAMAYSKACVVHSSFEMHMPEIAAFSNDETGISFVKDDPKDAARCIFVLLNNNERSGQMGRLARSRIISSFTIERMVNGFIEAVECALHL